MWLRRGVIGCVQCPEAQDRCQQFKFRLESPMNRPTPLQSASMPPWVKPLHVIRGARYLDVSAASGARATWRSWTASSQRWTLAQGAPEINGDGRWLVPGFIDAHVHIESSMLTPAELRPRCCRGHHHCGVRSPRVGQRHGHGRPPLFLSAAEQANLDLRVMLSSCVPATTMETNGGGHQRPQLASSASHPRPWASPK